MSGSEPQARELEQLLRKIDHETGPAGLEDFKSFKLPDPEGLTGTIDQLGRQLIEDIAPGFRESLSASDKMAFDAMMKRVQKAGGFTSRNLERLEEIVPLAWERDLADDLLEEVMDAMRAMMEKELTGKSSPKPKKKDPFSRLFD